MKPYIEEISKINSVMQVQNNQKSGSEKTVKQDKTDSLFNDLLLENIKKNKVNKGVLSELKIFPREKLKQLAEMIQLQLNSSLLSQMNDSEEKESPLTMTMPFLSLPDKSSLIDPLVSNFKQTQPGLKEVKSSRNSACRPISLVCDKASKSCEDNFPN